jgi:polar amino acid transport system permease protein
MVIFWSYFLLPIVIGQAVSGFTTLVGALIVYQGAYFAEIIRAGILTVPKGQFEAAAALSLSQRVVTWRIVLPQALRTMLPSLISQAVAGMKETSLGYVISVHEVTFSAQQINSMAINKPLEVFFVLAMIFFILCFSLSLWARLLERKMAKQGRA